MIVGAGVVVLADGVHRPGWVETTDGTIVACGGGVPPRPADVEFPDAVIVPGFVDMHVHGGGGASYTDGIADDITRAANFHLGHGTTTTVASLVTLPPDRLLRTIEIIKDHVGTGTLAGVHLEGPWLSSARCGAHDAAQLRAPAQAEIDAVCKVADGTVRMVTLAPELAGGLDAVRRLADAGVVVAVGHTEATYDQTIAALDAGATVGTHVFNAMRPLHHREPGPALALLQDPRATVELVADGVHVHSALIDFVMNTVGAERVSLITDAMAAAGMPDGSYRLGALHVDVRDHVARVRGTSTVAGSTATMDQLFRTAVNRHGGMASDEALRTASIMTSATPAAALGFDTVGSIRPGNRADLVVLDDAGTIIDVMSAGRWRAEAAVG